MTRSRTLKGSLVAAVAAGALTACTAHPGAAAVVGSDRISNGQLDDVARALCSAQAGSQPINVNQGISSRAARQGALDVLINGSLSRQFAKAKGITPSQPQVSAALAANQQTMDALPASERATFRDTLLEYAEGQLIVLQAGTRALAQQGTQAPTQQQALQAGVTVRDAWASEHAPVTVNPRYGRYVHGILQSTDGSLSVPVSASAVAAVQADPGQSWVSSLPATQKCS